jgi:predicted amidophosphoribosyltransferase
MESERVCSRCGTINRADAKYCEICAAPLDAATESGAQFVEDDLALRHVDPNNRVEIGSIRALG